MPESARKGQWAAVIGSPIDHSLSPVLHQCAYDLVGVEAQYRRYQVEEADLGDFLANLDPGCLGLSVTMPCKKAILPYLDTNESLAKALGVVNTVVMTSSMRAGFNTDVHGIVESIRDSYQVHGAPKLPWENLRQDNSGRKAVILGTGATASSALAAVVSLGYGKICVVGRSFAGPNGILRAGGKLGVSFDPLLWKHFPAVVSACQQADLLISTVPTEVCADLAGELSPSAQQRLLDVVYAKHDSALERAYRQAVSISPLRMLVHQGLAQVKLMTGKEAPFAPVYEAVSEAARV